MTDTDGAPPYEVGYGRPPVHTRFQPGRSGNPKGRPRGGRNLRTDLAQELRERVVVKEGGRQRAISKQRAMVKGLIAKALGGDMRAANLVVAMMSRLLDVGAEAPASDGLVAADDEAILQDFLRRHADGGGGAPAADDGAAPAAHGAEMAGAGPASASERDPGP